MADRGSIRLGNAAWTGGKRQASRAGVEPIALRLETCETRGAETRLVWTPTD